MLFHFRSLILIDLLQETAAASAAKRAKLEATVVIEEPEPQPMEIQPVKPPELIELSESFIGERLSVEIATELVMDSMVCAMRPNERVLFPII